MRKKSKGSRTSKKENKSPKTLLKRERFMRLTSLQRVKVERIKTLNRIIPWGAQASTLILCLE